VSAAVDGVREHRRSHAGQLPWPAISAHIVVLLASLGGGAVLAHEVVKWVKRRRLLAVRDEHLRVVDRSLPSACEAYRSATQSSLISWRWSCPGSRPRG
jgi:hypothetical protein